MTSPWKNEDPVPPQVVCGDDPESVDRTCGFTTDLINFINESESLPGECLTALSIAMGGLIASQADDQDHFDKGIEIFKKQLERLAREFYKQRLAQEKRR
jgi:hypothetical protein